TVPLEPVARRLRSSQYDALRGSALGDLVLARAEGRTGPVDDGFEDLRRATLLALQKAAADRDREQAAWATVRKASVAELGDEDPVGALLARATATLTAAAGDQRAAGGALLALNAGRWHGSCEERQRVRSPAACRGLDRVDAIGAAGHWAPDVERLAQ